MITHFASGVLARGTQVRTLIRALLHRTELRGHRRIILATISITTLFHHIDRTHAIRLTRGGVALRIAPARIGITTRPTLLSRTLKGLLSGTVSFAPRDNHVALDTRISRRRIALGILSANDNVPSCTLSHVFRHFCSLPHTGKRGDDNLKLTFIDRITHLFGNRIALHGIRRNNILTSLQLRHRFA